MHKPLLNRQNCPPSNFLSMQTNVAFNVANGVDEYNRDISKANVSETKQRSFSPTDKDIVFQTSKSMTRLFAYIASLCLKNDCRVLPERLVLILWEVPRDSPCPTKTGVCFRCGQQGHQVRNCARQSIGMQPQPLHVGQQARITPQNNPN